MRSSSQAARTLAASIGGYSWPQESRAVVRMSATAARIGAANCMSVCRRERA